MGKHIYTRQQVREFREKSVAFLQQPELKKAVDLLDKGNGERCCLGHMCVALEVESHQFSEGSRIHYGVLRDVATAPVELVQMVGLNNYNGESIGGSMLGKWDRLALTSINDKTDATTQEIGAYLETVIEGGSGTPWVALSDIPEELSE